MKSDKPAQVDHRRPPGGSWNTMVEPQPPDDQGEHQLGHQDRLHDRKGADVKRHSMEHEADQSATHPNNHIG